MWADCLQTGIGSIPNAYVVHFLKQTYIIEWLHEGTEHLDKFFSRLSLNGSISDVLFTGGREVSGFSVIKYYSLNINYSVIILSKCLRILIDCSQLSKTYYNMLFGCSARENHS